MHGRHSLKMLVPTKIQMTDFIEQKVEKSVGQLILGYVDYFNILLGATSEILKAFIQLGGDAIICHSRNEKLIETNN